MTQFQDVAELHEQAYQAFSRMDAREHPAPLAPRWYQTFNFTMVIYAVALSASFALSSLSTGSVVSDSAKHFLGVELAMLEAVLSVLTLELVFSGTRFVMIFTDYKLRGVIPDSQTWMKAGFWLSFAMILLTNLYFRLGKLPDMNADLKSLMDVILGFMLAVAVPVMAFVSGDVLAILYITGDKARALLVGDYNTKMTTYLEARNRRWSVRKRDFGISDKLNAARQRLSVESSRESVVAIPATTQSRVVSSSATAATILATKMKSDGLVEASNATLKSTYGGMSDSTISTARRIARGE